MLPHPRTSLWSRPWRMLMALMVIVSTVMVGGSQAVAASPYATEATVSNVAFTETEVTAGTLAEVTADWSLPDNPTSPAGFTLPLDSNLTGRGDTFPITASDGSGQTIGTCTAETTAIVCEFDAAYLEENPLDLHGSINFWLMINRSTTPETDHEFVIGDATVPVDVTPAPTCNNCALNWTYNKYGAYDVSTNIITWWAYIKADRGGMKGGENVRVVDSLAGGDQQYMTDPTRVKLQYSNELGIKHDGREIPVNFEDVARDEWSMEFDDDGNLVVSFVAEAGYYYQVEYATQVNDGGASGTYSNRVDYYINNSHDGSSDKEVTFVGGGGTGLGTNVGKFALSKVVDGTNIPDDLTFTGTYTVKPTSGAAQSGTWSVKGGATWTSPAFPRGSTVTLTEDAPSGPGALEWATPSFSINSFELKGGTVTPVTLTNSASVASDTFQIRKDITGSDEAVSLVPEDATFLVDYSYPAGVGFEAGSGTLTLSADGTLVSSPDLPVGATVTLSERTPEAVEGAAWGDATITPSSLVVGQDEDATVVVENPITIPEGGFSLTKSVSGSGAALVADGTPFWVDYSWETADGRSGTGIVEVPLNGDPVSVDGLPVGATVTLTEAEPRAIDGVIWKAPVFSANGFTIEADTTIAVTLDNPTSIKTGSIAITKVLDGDITDRVPAETEFTVSYSYPAGTGFAAGEGTVIVKADGVAVPIEGLPFGALVTLEELTPPAIPGAVWGTPLFSQSQVLVADETVVSVELNNILVETPATPETPGPYRPTPTPTPETPTPETPTPTPTPETPTPETPTPVTPTPTPEESVTPTPTPTPVVPELAKTGASDLVGPLMGAGAVLVLAGAGLLVAKRRRGY